MEKLAIIEKVNVKEKCPYCGGVGGLKRWGMKYNPEDVRFAVECKRCGIHSEITRDAKTAVKNWEKQVFSELQKSLTKKLDVTEVDSEGVVNFIAAILETTSAGFRSKYKVYLKMDPSTENFDKYEQDVVRQEKELIKTIDYWEPSIAGKSVVGKIKEELRKEVEKELNGEG